MNFCAACTIKNCARNMGEEGSYPSSCPSVVEDMEAYFQQYEDPRERLIAQKSGICGNDKSEGRIEKTIRFAHECGFHKIGLAFCTTVADESMQIQRMLKKEGFQVESVICKVGHGDRAMLEIPANCRPMCNPIAQAELLNKAGTELNIMIGLCVGHDALFIAHSEAPVTVLVAKDHVYDHAPLEYLKEKQQEEEIDE